MSLTFHVPSSFCSILHSVSLSAKLYYEKTKEITFEMVCKYYNLSKDELRVFEHSKEENNNSKREKLEAEFEDLKAKIQYYKSILGDEKILLFVDENKQL